MAKDIGTLAATITANLAPGFTQTLDRAKGMLDKFGARFGVSDFTGFLGAGVGPGGIGAIAGAIGKVHPVVGLLTGAFTELGQTAVREISRTAQEIDRMAKASDRMGITTESFAGLQHAAELAGTDMHTLGTALDRLNRELGDAASGNQQAQKTFRRLGLDAQRLANIPLDKAFEEIAESISRLPTAAERATAAYSIFGRQAGQLNALMRDGREGIARARREMEVLGVAVSRSAASSVERMNDSISNAKKGVQGFWNDITIAIAPATAALADFITNLNIVMRFNVGAGSARFWVEQVGEQLGRTVRLATVQIRLAANLIRNPRTAFGETGRGLAGLQTEADREQAAAESAALRSAAIAEHVRQMEIQIATTGMLATQVQRYTLAMDGATNAQLANFDATARQAEQYRAAAGIMEGILHPATERAQNQFLGLRDAFKLGRLTADQFAQGSARITDELERAANLPAFRLPEALLEGSSAAISAINRFQNREATNPQQRVENILTQINRQQAEQVRVGRELIEAFERGALQQANF